MKREELIDLTEYFLEILGRCQGVQLPTVPPSRREVELFDLLTEPADHAEPKR